MLHLGAESSLMPGMTRQESAIRSAKDTLSRIYNLIDDNLHRHDKLQQYENQLMDAFTSIYTTKFSNTDSSTVDAHDNVDVVAAFTVAVNEYNHPYCRQIMTALIYNVLNVNVFGDSETNFEYVMEYWAKVYIRHKHEKFSVLFEILDDIILIFMNAYRMSGSDLSGMMYRFYDRVPDEEPVMKLVVFHAMRQRGLNIDSSEEYDFLTEIYVEGMKLEIDFNLTRRSCYETRPDELRTKFRNSIQLLYIMYDTERLGIVILNALHRNSDMVSEQILIKPVLAISIENCTVGVLKLFQVDMLKDAVKRLFTSQMNSQSNRLLIELMLIFRSRFGMSREEEEDCIREVLQHLTPEERPVFSTICDLTRARM